MNTVAENHPQRGSRRAQWVKLGLLALLFAAPIIAAFWWQPTGFVNSGELVTPARPLSNIVFATMDGAPFPLADLKSKWTLIYIGIQPCEEVCEKNLYKIRQVRLAQTKHAYRVQSVFVTPVTTSDAAVAALLSRYPGVIGLRADDRAMAALVDEFTYKQAKPPEAGRVYVVDPLGNLMMSYPPDADPSAMRKDLNRLLKVSQVG